MKDVLIVSVTLIVGLVTWLMLFAWCVVLPVVGLLWLCGLLH